MTKAEAAVNASFGQFTRDLKAYEDEHRAELVAAERDRLAAEKELADLRAADGCARPMGSLSLTSRDLTVGSPPAVTIDHGVSRPGYVPPATGAKR